MKASLSVNFERFTLEGLSYNPGNVKLWESPGISGGLPLINYEGCNEQQATNNTKPKQAIDEVWIDAQHGTGNHCGDFALPLPINKVGHSKYACDKSNKESIHVKLSECPHKLPRPSG